MQIINTLNTFLPSKLITFPIFCSILCYSKVISIWQLVEFHITVKKLTHQYSSYTIERSIKSYYYVWRNSVALRNNIESSGKWKHLTISLRDRDGNLWPQACCFRGKLQFSLRRRIFSILMVSRIFADPEFQ